MAAPKTALHHITVDGLNYRWHIYQSYNRTHHCYEVNFSVERDAGRGEVTTPLHVETVRGRFKKNLWWDLVGEPITPSEVAATIREALAAGWHPAQSGKPFLLSQAQNEVAEPA